MRESRTAPPNAPLSQRHEKAPLSQKGGWGDFYTYTYTYTYAYISPQTTASLMLLR